MPPGAIQFLLPSLTTLRGGGIERASRALVEAVAAARPRAALEVVLGREPALEHPEVLSSVLRGRVRVTGAGSMPGRLGSAQLVARGLGTLLRRGDGPALVVCGHLHYAPLGHALAVATGARLVLVAHGIEAWAIRSPLIAHALRRADRVLAVSSYTATQLLAVHGVTAARVRVLANPVDTERFRPGPPAAAVEAQLATLPHPRVLSVTRLDAREGYKGIDEVLQGLARSRRAVSYVVVGEGTDRPRLEALARRLGVTTLFAGYVPEEQLADYYRAADCFALPSRGEGFGCVFVEALACGLPVVAGGVDGSVDALGGGRLGLLVNPLDPDEIARAITAHLDGESPPETRNAAWLHAQVEERFGVAAFTRRVAAILAELDPPTPPGRA